MPCPPMLHAVMSPPESRIPVQSIRHGADIDEPWSMGSMGGDGRMDGWVESGRCVGWSYARAGFLAM